MEAIKYITGSVLALFGLYIATRLCSAAFYRSKKEFTDWYHSKPKRREGD